MTTQQLLSPRAIPGDVRRRRIMSAAGRLFSRDGYEATGIAEIAASARVGAATIYELVGTKQQVLAEVIRSSLTDAVDGIAAIDATAPDWPERLAALAMSHRHVGVLWQRDIRFVADEVQAEARALIRRFAEHARARVQQQRGDLTPIATEVVTWAVVAVLVSPSLHRTPAPGPVCEQRIGRLIRRLLGAPNPDRQGEARSAPVRDPETSLPASRREALLVTAVRLFADRGFSDVSLDDIGAAVGVSGPSIYHHFPSKQHLLLSAAMRAGAALQTSVMGAYLRGGAADQVLGAMVESYVRFALSHHHLLSMLMTETGNLPPEQRAQTVDGEREYLGEWSHLLGLHRGEREPDPGRMVEVHAAIDIANTVARIVHLRADPVVASYVPELCRWLLGIG